MSNKPPKHIALWSCPRSCSTLLSRSFEQRNDCIVIDEPFYPPYLLTKGLDHPLREEIINNRETDYKEAIKTITKELPNNISFSFQKHIAKNILPEFGMEWLKSLHNIFLIRDPSEVILSYINVMGSADEEGVGYSALFKIFKAHLAVENSCPIIIDAKDLLKDPTDILIKLCEKLSIPFTNQMLSWESGFKDSDTIMGKELSNFKSPFQSSLVNSTGFQPYTKKESSVPAKYFSLHENCLEIYNYLYKFKI